MYHLLKEHTNSFTRNLPVWTTLADLAVLVQIPRREHRQCPFQYIGLRRTKNISQNFLQITELPPLKAMRL